MGKIREPPACPMMESPPPVLAIFAHERGDARVRKRVSALQAEGWQVQGWMFHRQRERDDLPVFWDNIELGITRNRRYFRRVWVLVKSLGILWKHRRRAAQADIFYAVNLDNALLALTARWMSRGCKTVLRPVVLELADVQPAMVGRGLRSQLLQTLERWVLRHCSLLITTSPGFLRHYFEPVHGRRDGVFLLENKVYDPAVRRPGLPAGAVSVTDADGRRGQWVAIPETWKYPRTLPLHDGRPWVIGYFGAFRCLRSIRMIRRLAEQFPDRLHFVLRGYPSGTDPDLIAQALVGLPNLEYGGSYQYPQDLEEMYGKVDLNWTFDFADPSGNSAWLLPNRIYEGGFYGCPALADSATETGTWVQRLATGWALAEPLETTLNEFFTHLGTAQWGEIREHCLGLDRALFAGREDYQKLSSRLLEMVRPLSAVASGSPLVP